MSEECPAPPHPPADPELSPLEEDSLEEEPEVLEPEPEPPEPEPELLEPAPELLEPEPEPLGPEPELLEPEPEPLDPETEPLDPEPDPLDPEPTPEPVAPTLAAELLVGPLALPLLALAPPTPAEDWVPASPVLPAPPWLPDLAVVVSAAHLKFETSFESIVTAPFRASALPLTVAPVVRVMLVSARMLPTNAVVVPRVAELPTCQNTLQSVAPLRRTTVELLAVVSVLPIWKTNVAAGSPSASRVSVPVSCAAAAKW